MGNIGQYTGYIPLNQTLNLKSLSPKPLNPKPALGLGVVLLPFWDSRLGSKGMMEQCRRIEVARPRRQGCRMWAVLLL